MQFISADRYDTTLLEVPQAGRDTGERVLFLKEIEKFWLRPFTVCKRAR